MLADHGDAALLCGVREAAALVKAGWIGVDLDGTLAHDDKKPFNPAVIGEPVPEMVKRVKRWLRERHEVRIVTARVNIAEPERSLRIAQIGAWCMLHLGQVLPVVCCKDFQMIELWDDRVVQVYPNTGEAMGVSRIPGEE